MKKLIAAVLVFMLVLAACSNGAQTEIPPESEPEVPEKAENSEPMENTESTENSEIEIIDEVSYKNKNGKFGFHKNGVPITEPIFDEITAINKIDAEKGAMVFTETASNIYAGIITDGTRKEVKLDWEKGAQLTEAPNILYTLYQSGDDFVINETPLSKFGFYEPGDYGTAIDDNLIIGVHEGDYYEYQQKKDGSWKLRTKDSGGVYYAYNEDFYFTRYHWNLFACRYGLVTPDGKTILEPIFACQPELINDYFIVYDGYPSMHQDDIVRTVIVDKKGNIINDEYDFITITSWNGRFLLIAQKSDETGDNHVWFIDENGEKLSKSYNRIEPISDPYNKEGDIYKTAKVWPDKVNFNIDDETEIIPTDEFVQYYK